MASKVIETGHGKVKRVKIGGHAKLEFIRRLSTIENRYQVLKMDDRIAKIYDYLGVDRAYKSCFEKNYLNLGLNALGVIVDTNYSSSNKQNYILSVLQILRSSKMQESFLRLI